VRALEPWLRPVAPADLADLAEIHAQAFDHPWSAEALRATLDGAHVFGLAAGAGERTAGFILVSSIAGEAEILTLAVRPADRRRGIAAALVEAASGVALARTGEVMWLEVAEDNPAAIALYGHAGFVPAGRRPRYYPRPNGVFVGALLMRRPLNTGLA
jgi:[ribosomal protein S18]-alanine N-acetyltransferase